MYEYKVVKESVDFLQVGLNKYAEEGWRVVSVQWEPEGWAPSAVVVLEKPRQESQKAG